MSINRGNTVKVDAISFLKSCDKRYNSLPKIRRQEDCERLSKNGKEIYKRALDGETAVVFGIQGDGYCNLRYSDGFECGVYDKDLRKIDLRKNRP